MQDVLTYAEFDTFWEQFRPETPFGREEKDRRTVYMAADALGALWDETEVALAFLTELNDDAVRLTRVMHHLKRLPRFPDEAHPAYDEVELFQFKKFLHNYKCLTELVSPAVASAFGFAYASESFATQLDVGRQSAESFFVSDAYSEELTRIRAELRATEEGIEAARAARAAEIQARWGLAFEGREFLVVPKALLGSLESAAALLRVEPYDEQAYLVRPLAGAAELLLAEKKTALLAAERTAEGAVLASLSLAAREELPRFLAYRETVRRFDLALARARLAQDFDLVRPTLTDGPMRIQQGRFLPCEAACRALGIPYTPLETIFDTRVTAIFGSNMGGKTVVLKTVAFLQLCAQTGFFVPAAAFETRVFHQFHYLGEGCVKDDAQGLSGFGFEIRQLNRAWASLAESSLLLFDEFARTTSSHEAEALLSAVMESLAACPSVLALFSTHFRGVKRLDGVRYFRMKGLDHAGLDLHGADGAPIDERIRLINRHMDHRLVPDDADRALSDAIAVATLLGLDAAVAARALRHFHSDEPRTQE